MQGTVGSSRVDGMQPRGGARSPVTEPHLDLRGADAVAVLQDGDKLDVLGVRPAPNPWVGRGCS